MSVGYDADQSLDHLENICVLLNELQRLKNENLVLRRRIRYLEEQETCSRCVPAHGKARGIPTCFNRGLKRSHSVRRTIRRKRHFKTHAEISSLTANVLDTLVHRCNAGQRTGEVGITQDKRLGIKQAKNTFPAASRTKKHNSSQTLLSISNILDDAELESVFSCLSCNSSNSSSSSKIFQDGTSPNPMKTHSARKNGSLKTTPPSHEQERECQYGPHSLDVLLSFVTGPVIDRNRKCQDSREKSRVNWSKVRCLFARRTRKTLPSKSRSLDRATGKKLAASFCSYAEDFEGLESLCHSSAKSSTRSARSDVDSPVTKRNTKIPKRLLTRTHSLSNISTCEALEQSEFECGARSRRSRWEAVKELFLLRHDLTKDSGGSHAGMAAAAMHAAGNPHALLFRHVDKSFLRKVSSWEKAKLKNKQKTLLRGKSAAVRRFRNREDRLLTHEEVMNAMNISNSASSVRGAYPCVDVWSDRVDGVLGVQEKCIRNGLKAVQTRLRKGERGIVVFAGDVTPIELICHLPAVCEEKGLPYVYVPTAADLNAAFGTERKQATVLIKAHETYQPLYDECIDEINKLPPVF